MSDEVVSQMLEDAMWDGSELKPQILTAGAGRVKSIIAQLPCGKNIHDISVFPAKAEELPGFDGVLWDEVPADPIYGGCITVEPSRSLNKMQLMQDMSGIAVRDIPIGPECYELLRSARPMGLGAPLKDGLAFLMPNYCILPQTVERIRSADLEVLSRVMRKLVCRLWLNKVSRQ